MKPLAALDDLVDPPLIDAQLEGDFLLRHLRRSMKLQDPSGEFRRHLPAGDAASGSYRPLGAIPLPKFLQDGKGHVHSLLAQGIL